MTLRTYRQKRNFQRTPEPSGKGPPKRGPTAALRFVVQKHAAKKLHYDFRLEAGGSLKSWAIPKGPSLKPGEKRLAVQVEDHPLEYRTFEGVIPQGNYGGGTVMVWDEGTYHVEGARSRKESEAKLRAGIKAGRLSFVLSGKKLRGAFSLVQMRGRGEEAWLLVKKEDAFSSDREITNEELSVRTQRNLGEISAVGKPPKPPGSKRPVTLRAEGWISPMLATLVDQPFDKKGWLFELKWDGYRAIAEAGPKAVRLYSRNQKSFEEKYPEIVESLKKIKKKMILDGEIVAVDDAGRSSFQWLQNYNQTGKGTLAYWVFDILNLEGKDLTHLPLLERKNILARELPSLPLIHLSEHIREKGTAFFRELIKNDVEGMVAKNESSFYAPGKRTGDWLKVKTHLRQEVIICGYTAPRGSRQKFGSLLLGAYEAGRLVYLGHAGTGFDRLKLSELYKIMRPLERDKCPFDPCPKPNAPAKWLTPKLVGEVKFQEWTQDGRMRQPSFLGLRMDKVAKDVHREKPKRVDPILTGRERAKKKSKSRAGTASEAPVLTHLDKIYWPGEKLTKGDLLAYYGRVASLMLPYLKDRPQSLHRHPNGITGESFFHKNMEETLPPFADSVVISSEGGKEIRYLLCQNKETLLYMANLGCIEINPWNSRTPNLGKPDYLVIDLDPEAISFDKVIQTAIEVRKILELGEIESYCKTSGATGLHIYVPLKAKYEYELARQFAELVANLVEKKISKITSTVRDPKKRPRRVYLDYLQNRQGQTLAAPYSVRPRPGAPVSTPLRWDEVKKGLDPTSFTIFSIFDRIEKYGDLFRPVLEKAADLKRAVGSLSQTA